MTTVSETHEPDFIALTNLRTGETLRVGVEALVAMWIEDAAKSAIKAQIRDIMARMNTVPPASL